MTTSLKQIIPLSLALFALLGYQFIGATWTNAPASPPNSNVPAPINVGVDGASSQALSGGLAADTFAASNGLAIGVYNTSVSPSQLTAWRVVRNDGTGNLLTYINTTGGNSPTYETPGHAFRERYNVGNGEYHFQTANAAGAAGGAITWENNFKIMPGGRVGATQYCDISGNNCSTSVSGGGDMVFAGVKGTYFRTEIGYGDEIAGSYLCPAGLILYDTNDNDKAARVQSTGYNDCGVTLSGTYKSLGYTQIGSDIVSGNGRTGVTLFEKINDGSPTGYYWQTRWSACSAATPPSCGTTHGTETLIIECFRASTGAKVANSNCDSGTKPAATTRACSRSDTTGCRCFIAGTLVTMADGSTKNIEDVQIGDELKGANGTNKVLDFERPQLGERKLFSINGGPHFVTPAHPFKTTDGWKSISMDEIHRENTALVAELSITELQIGDELIKADGATEIVTSIEGADAEPQTLYNFTLDGDSTYFVNGLLTHTEFSSKEMVMY